MRRNLSSASGKHLLVINGNELYATCRKSVMQFDSFGVDTREFYCAYGEREDKK